MKILPKLVLLHVLCFSAFPVVAEDGSGYNQDETADSLKTLVLYLKNLGGYLGYDVTTEPEKLQENYKVSYTLINLPMTQLAQTYLFYTFLGALPVNAFNNNSFAQFVPKEVPGASIINPLANTTFNEQNYSAPSAEQIGINPLIDQKTYQADPVSQGILNILSTPNYTYCMEYGASAWPRDKKECDYLSDTSIPARVIGTVPKTKEFFSYNYVQQFLSQLNSNTLTAPLMYSTESPQKNSTSSPSATNKKDEGLIAENQAQQAANFVRYISGAVLPVALPKWKEYDVLYTHAFPTAQADQNSVEQHQAHSAITKYLTSLRSYAALNSVGLSNLYYMMSKRLPQSQSSAENHATPMSQLMSEFNMSTWRLFNPNSNNPGGTQWINQINNATPATVEKEIAMLLAEINYQMFLDRQMNERLLLTNSAMLLINVRTAQPSFEYSAQGQEEQSTSGQ